ncbi:hypothetical protein [Bordetella pertussis]|uniref:hypothetical protein n=1 Tax=Bordetella pertussis TaxID=520 RepID=UPI001D0E04C7
MRKVELMQHMDHQAAEAAAEIDVLPGRDALVRETPPGDDPGAHGARGKIGGTQRTRQVDADDLRASASFNGRTVKSWTGRARARREGKRWKAGAVRWHGTWNRSLFRSDPL